MSDEKLAPEEPTDNDELTGEDETAPEVRPHSGIRAPVSKDFKPTQEHNDTFAYEGRLYCTRDALEWPCPDAVE